MKDQYLTSFLPFSSLKKCEVSPNSRLQTFDGLVVYPEPFCNASVLLTKSITINTFELSMKYRNYDDGGSYNCLKVTASKLEEFVSMKTRTGFEASLNLLDNAIHFFQDLSELSQCYW